jgi:hypothetical protein
MALYDCASSLFTIKINISAVSFVPVCLVGPAHGTQTDRLWDSHTCVCAHPPTILAEPHPNACSKLDVRFPLGICQAISILNLRPFFCAPRYRYLPVPATVYGVQRSNLTVLSYTCASLHSVISYTFQVPHPIYTCSLQMMNWARGHMN